jgi:hypothetical protein
VKRQQQQPIDRHTQDPMCHRNIAKECSMQSEQNTGPEVLADTEENDRILEILEEYSGDISEYLWPLEALRWYELVFSILVTIGEPEVLAESLRDVTNKLADFGLLEVDELSKINPADDQAITIKTVLVKAGFSEGQAESALRAVCEAASGIQDNYEGRIQDYYLHYANQMLHNIEKDFNFSDFYTAPKAISVWLQNTLNMPIPGSNVLADKACESLGTTYDKLVNTVRNEGYNIAILDNALRAYWEEKFMRVAEKP